MRKLSNSVKHCARASPYHVCICFIVRREMLWNKFPLWQLICDEILRATVEQISSLGLLMGLHTVAFDQ